MALLQELVHKVEIVSGSRTFKYVVVALAVMLLAAVLPQDAGLLKNSQPAPMLIEYNETLAQYIPQEAREAYETNRDNLLRDWIARAAKTVTRSAPSPQASPSPGTDRK